MKNKIYKLALKYIFLIFLLALLSFTFLFGIKIGYSRLNPYFDYVYKVYVFYENWKSNITNIFFKNKYQTVKNKSHFNENKIRITKDNLSLFYEGDMPKDIILALTASLWTDNILNHYLIFFSNNKIIHYVLLDELDKFSINKNLYKWPHGLVISNKGEIYYNFDGGNSLVKKNICGKRIWDIQGNYHHLMSLNNDYLWVLEKSGTGNPEFVEKFKQINSTNGGFIKSFNVNDLIVANAPNDYFSIKQRDLTSIWEYEPFHFNDIDVLTKEKEKYFSNFSEGDLMISSRSLNSIFIINSKTLKIKNLFYGITRRQHDPDWNNGYISIYDNQTEWGNNKRFANSRIVKIDLMNKSKVSVMNFDKQFISDARGNHDIYEVDKNESLILVTSPYEGSLLLFKNNKNIFSIHNEQKSDVLAISNGKILEKNLFSNKISLCNQ